MKINLKNMERQDNYYISDIIVSLLYLGMAKVYSDIKPDIDLSDTNYDKTRLPGPNSR